MWPGNGSCRRLCGNGRCRSTSLSQNRQERKTRFDAGVASWMENEISEESPKSWQTQDVIEYHKADHLSPSGPRTAPSNATIRPRIPPRTPDQVYLPDLPIRQAAIQDLLVFPHKLPPVVECGCHVLPSRSVAKKIAQICNRNSRPLSSPRNGWTKTCFYFWSVFVYIQNC